jgi:osmotically-inducible protein OsmY
MGTSTRIAITVAVNLAVACRERDTEADVRQALEQAHIDTVAVDVEDDGRVVLQGTARSLADRTRAAEVAHAVVGTAGRVLNEVSVPGLAERAAEERDRELEKVLEAKIEDEPMLGLRDIKFDVRKGIVAVRGEVRSADEKNRVTRIVRAAPGVTSVSNGLVIDEQP